MLVEHSGQVCESVNGEVREILIYKTLHIEFDSASIRGRFDSTNYYSTTKNVGKDNYRICYSTFNN